MISINYQLCKACGICGDVCPRHIPETIEDDNRTTRISSERIHLCMECGHCAAVCPNGAIEVECFSRENFTPVTSSDISENQFLGLLRQRRSVRRYKNKPVPREVISRIIDAVHGSPTGTGRMTTGVIVIDNRDTLARFSEHIYAAYEGLNNKMKNPLARFFIKRRAGKRKFETLSGFVMPAMRWYIQWYKEGLSNEILRDCPVLMLFHSPIREPVGRENCLIAAFHAVMMAQIMNMGGCLNDLIPPMCNRLSAIRSLLRLADDREVYASITMGYPRYNFQRVIPRKLAEVRYAS